MSKPMSATRPITIGIDLGGTGIRLVALDEAGQVHGEQTTQTPQQGSDSDLAMRELLHQIRAVADGRPVIGIGIGASGPIDADGVIRNDDTLAVFSHLRLADLVSSEIGVPCVIDNDAVTAAVGENAYGAGENAESLLMVTLGTGIGVALLVGGRPVRAADGTHPEAGHLPVPGASAPCYCGLPTCWEQVASRTALDHLTSGRTADFATRARRNHADVETVFDLYGSRVAAGLAILLPLTRPARLVLGGSAAQYLPLFSAALDQSLQRAPGFSYYAKPFSATLGAMSGAIGAAVLARQMEHAKPSPCTDGVHA
jgi:glucokinase